MDTLHSQLTDKRTGDAPSPLLALLSAIYFGYSREKMQYFAFLRGVSPSFWLPSLS